MSNQGERTPPAELMQLIILGILWQLSELLMPVPKFSKAVNSSSFWHGHRWSGVCESFSEWL